MPCEACPYRADVPPAIWAPSEYEKLLEYEGVTADQTTDAFACHATPDHYCHGWAVVGTHKRPISEDLLALRIRGIGADDVPQEVVPLLDGHLEAHDRGMEPRTEATDELAARLVRKYPRLEIDP